MGVEWHRCGATVASGMVPMNLDLPPAIEMNFGFILLGSEGIFTGDNFLVHPPGCA